MITGEDIVFRREPFYPATVDGETRFGVSEFSATIGKIGGQYWAQCFTHGRDLCHAPRTTLSGAKAYVRQTFDNVERAMSGEES